MHAALIMTCQEHMYLTGVVLRVVASHVEVGRLDKGWWNYDGLELWIKCALAYSLQQGQALQLPFQITWSRIFWLQTKYSALQHTSGKHARAIEGAVFVNCANACQQ